MTGDWYHVQWKVNLWIARGEKRRKGNKLEIRRGDREIEKKG